MKASNTFRLFISSTFDDFRRERELLQTKVFPHIKEYCSNLGYTFQPIDLRWGVSNEAQLDQKTLELCLDEVKSCKSYAYPNFLIMIGDRYGWIPLPHIIEKVEFESLLPLMTEQEVHEMKAWYLEDRNQIPVSYILKERRGPFNLFENWSKVEENLRSIFQKIVVRSTLSNEQKRKYFLSATEAEVEEGVIPYIHPTLHQKILLEENPELITHDANNIFGFFRDIDLNSKKSEKFITSDYHLAQAFKTKVKSELLEKNILHIQTKQVTEKSLKESYLSEFVEKAISFLESKVDEQKTKAHQNKRSDLDLELVAQHYFAKQKRTNFIGQESLLNRIEDYINNENQQALIIYGESGKGKSALMAKAIEQAKSKKDRKVIFRFIGASAQSDTSKKNLISIFMELGNDVTLVDDTTDDQENNEKISIQNAEEETETFEAFSYRIADQILNLKDHVVIFLDAIDQLSNDDPLIWLPSKLPSNVKIIISALSDKKYERDSKYFARLKNKSQNLERVQPFEMPLILLKNLLEKENRTIQKHQETYFLEQFEKHKSPFFVFVAMQEIKYWKSFDLVPGQNEPTEGRIQKLTEDGKGIVSKFIQNLSTNYHHENRLVQKVLGCLLASRDGLSESEILELLSVDEAFVQQMAPETWHENLNKELPLVIWTRLYASLKPFLSLKLEDGEELMYFFHREFEDAIKNSVHQKVEHEMVISATQKLINKYQFDDFDKKRWGKLYQIIETNFNETYNNQNNKNEFALFIAKLDSTLWKKSYLKYILGISVSLNNSNSVTKAIYNATNANIISKYLYKENKDKWLNFYSMSLINLSLFNFKINNFQIALEKSTLSLQLLKPNFDKNAKLLDSYMTGLGNHTVYLKELNKIDEALETYGELFEILGPILNDKPTISIFNKSLYALLNMSALFLKRMGEHDVKAAEAFVLLVIEKTKNIVEEDKLYLQFFIKATTLMGVIRNAQGKLSEAKFIEEGLTDFLEQRRNTTQQEIGENEITSQLNLMRSYSDTKDFLKAKELGLRLEPNLRKLIKLNRRRWIESEYRFLGSLSIAYSGLGQNELAYGYMEKCLNVVDELYSENPQRWQEEYLRTIVNFSFGLKEKNELEKGMAILKKGLEIVKPLFLKNQFQWGEIYLTILNNLSDLLSLANQHSSALRCDQEAFDIAKNLYNQAPERWGNIYANILVNMATTLHKMDFGPDASIKLLVRAYEIIKPLFKEKPAYWGEPFIHCLKNLVNFYSNYKYIDKENIVRKEILQVTSKLYKIDPIRFGLDYSVELTENLVLSFDKNKMDVALNYGIQALLICKKGITISPAIWNGKYVDILYLMSKIKYQIQEIHEAIKILDEGYIYLKKLYSEDRKWKENFIKFLVSLSNLCHETGNIQKAKEYDRILQFIGNQ